MARRQIPGRLLLIFTAMLAALVLVGAAASAETAKSEPTPATSEKPRELSAATTSYQWLDGQIGYTYLNHFYLGNMILTGQYVGYWGTLDGSFPKVGDVYWGHVVVYNVSTIPIVVYPEVKLPPNTRFSVSSSTPIRSFKNGTEVSGGPRAPGQSDYQAGYWSLKPSDPSQVWGLQGGESLEIWFPVVSSAPLDGDLLHSAVAPLSSAGTVTPIWGTSSGPVYVYARPDATDPTISSVAPAPGSSTRKHYPVIGATVRDNVTNLATHNIRLYVDNSEITAFSYNSDTDRLYYRSGYLSHARHTVKIVATDDAGNQATKIWSFKVVRR